MTADMESKESEVAPTVVADSSDNRASSSTSDDQPASDNAPNIPAYDQKRSCKPPAYLQDYFCNMTETSIPYHLAAYVSYEKLSTTYKSYICSVMHHPEPSSFAQAKKFD